LTRARVWHRQRRRRTLADLRIRALRRQQRRWIQAEIGECGVDERLNKLAGDKVGYVALEEGT
jgi:hypothetical protein